MELVSHKRLRGWINIKDMILKIRQVVEKELYWDMYGKKLKLVRIFYNFISKKILTT